MKMVWSYNCGFDIKDNDLSHVFKQSYQGKYNTFSKSVSLELSTGKKC